jgi:hypothetical protein
MAISNDGHYTSIDGYITSIFVGLEEKSGLAAGHGLIE